MKKAFGDTCIFIAITFLINSHYTRAKNVFNTYDEIFWSINVKNEFNNRFDEKYDKLLEIFSDIQEELEKINKEFYCITDLKKYIKRNFKDNKFKEAENSVNPFWNKYIGNEDQVIIIKMQHAIDKCLIDLRVISSLKKNELNKNILLTPKRDDEYSKINIMLETNGVTEKDRIIALDGHDFALRSNFDVDLITFDDAFYFGAEKVKKLAFSNIKSKYDFKTT